MTQTMILALQSVGFGKNEVFALSFSLSKGGRRSSQKNYGNPNPKGIYTVLLLGLSDLSSTRFRLLNLVQDRS